MQGPPLMSVHIVFMLLLCRHEENLYSTKLRNKIKMIEIECRLGFWDV